MSTLEIEAGEACFLRQEHRADPWLLVTVVDLDARHATILVPGGEQRRVLRSRLFKPARVDPQGPAALALRALQKLDQLESLEWRSLLLEAQGELGELLGLECTGVEEGGGYYDHSAGTCPVHEWLMPDTDPAACDELLAARRPR